jgi:uncharacterized UBP type Zn finger protein
MAASTSIEEEEEEGVEHTEVDSSDKQFKPKSNEFSCLSSSSKKTSHRKPNEETEDNVSSCFNFDDETFEEPLNDDDDADFLFRCGEPVLVFGKDKTTPN